MEVSTVFMCAVVVFRRRGIVRRHFACFRTGLRLILHALVVIPLLIKGIEISCLLKIIHSFLKNCFIVVLDQNT